MYHEKNHKIKYESFPLICFFNRRFGHLKEACPSASLEKEGDENRIGNNREKSTSHNIGEKNVQERVEKEEFGDWMVLKFCVLLRVVIEMDPDLISFPNWMRRLSKVRSKM